MLWRTSDHSLQSKVYSETVKHFSEKSKQLWNFFQGENSEWHDRWRKRSCLQPPPLWRDGFLHPSIKPSVFCGEDMSHPHKCVLCPQDVDDRLGRALRSCLSSLLLQWLFGRDRDRIEKLSPPPGLTHQEWVVLNEGPKHLDITRSHFIILHFSYCHSEEWNRELHIWSFLQEQMLSLEQMWLKKKKRTKRCLLLFDFCSFALFSGCREIEHL